MNGRLERELKAEAKMKRKLMDLPLVFTEFYYALEAEGKSYMTLNNYINYVVDFMNYVTNGRHTNTFYVNVKATNINQYMASIRRREVNGEMVRTGDDIRALRWSALNAFFKFLKNNDYVNENIVERTNRPEIRTEHTVTYLEKDEIGDLLRNVRNTADRKRLSRDLCMISLFLATGLRESAVTQINIDDVDLKNNVITVIEKGDKKRKIQFGDNLKELLINCMNDRYTNFCRVDSDALFLSKNGTRMTTQAVRDLVKKYTKVIDGKHITPHKLRATAATSLAASGVSLQAVASVLGHKNIQTTKRYVAVLEKEKDEAVNVLDNLI